MVSAEDILIRITGQDSTGSAFGSIQSRAGALKTALGGAMTAMSASMLGYAKSAVDSAMTAEQEWMKFGNAINNTGGNWEQQSTEIKKWVRDYSNSMGRSVADTRSAMTTYMNMGMSLQESQQAMQATSNYAAQMGMSQEQAAGQLQKAFMGSGRALKALGLDISNYKDETTGAIDRQKLLNDVLQRTGGAADKYAESSTAKFQRLNNVLASLKTDFGAALMDAITPLIPVVQGFLNVINGLPGPVKSVGFAAIALGAGIGIIAGPLTSVIGLMEMLGFTLPSISGLMGILGAETAALSGEELALAAAQAGLTAEELGAAIAHANNGVALAAEGAAATGASGGFWTMAAAELAALWPVLLIIAAVAALIVVVEQIGEALGWWTDFGTMIDAIRAGVMRLWEAFVNSPQVQGILAAIQSAFQALWTAVKPIFDWLGAAWNNLFSSDGAGSGGPDVVGAIINAFATLGNIASQVFSIIQAGWNVMMSVISPVVNMIQTVVTIIGQLINGQISLEQAVIGIFTAIGTMYQQIGTVLLSLAQTVVSAFIQQLMRLPSMIVQTLQQIGNSFTSVLSGVAGTVGNTAKNIGSSIYNGIVGRIRNVGGGVSSALSGLGGRVASAGSSVVSRARFIGNGVRNAIVNGIRNAPPRVTQILRQIAVRLLAIRGAIVARARSIATGIRTGILNRISSIPGRIGGIIGRIPGLIAGAAGAVAGAAAGLASQAVNAVISGFSGLAGKVYQEFVNIGNKIRESVSSAVSAATAFGNDIKAAVLGALGIASPGIIQKKIAIEFADIPGRIKESITAVSRSAREYANGILDGFGNPSISGNLNLNPNVTGSIPQPFSMGGLINPLLNNFLGGSLNVNSLSGLNSSSTYTPMANRGGNVTIIVSEGAVQLDARNLTTAESKQVMINALEGMDMIRNVNIRGDYGY